MKCAGQDSRFWDLDAVFEIPCEHCGYSVEFFKDDTSITCPKCERKMLNPHIDFGCASHCKFAEQCLGDLPPELLAIREDLLKDRVALEMKRHFGRDFKRIGHATKVARYAEEIAREEGGNMAVILASAYLHDIGIREAELKHGSSAAQYQEREGPPIARRILEGLDAQPELIDEVCDIVGHHHHPREEETINFRVLYDADLIVNLLEACEKSPMSDDKLEKILANNFFTEHGSKVAGRVLKKALEAARA